MIRFGRRPYNKCVKGMQWRGAVLPLLAIAFALAATASRANADVTTIATSGNPVVFLRVTTGTVTVRTWDRTDVSIDADPGVELRHFAGPQVMLRYPAQVPLWSQTVRTRDGEFTLPAEAFVVPPPQAAVNDAIVVHGDGNVTVTLPANTAMITTVVTHGDVAIVGYRNGVFISRVGNGMVRLEKVAGTGMVQTGSGPINAIDSDFTRIRLRSAHGTMIFERCNAKQIEATTLTGSIVYDNGTFEPGFAHFESERGNVALGVAGGAVQINARSTNGEVNSAFGNEARVTRNGGEAQAVVGSGGPVVTATSSAGSVFLYKGTLRNNPELQHRTPTAILRQWHMRRRPPIVRPEPSQQKLPHHRHI